MEIKKGIAVSHGVAIAPAIVLDAVVMRVPRRPVPRSELPGQHHRLDEALTAARNEVEQLRDQFADQYGPDPAKIFSTHFVMLQDQSLIDQVQKFIDDESVTAEYALSAVMRGIARKFLDQPNPLFRERATDVHDLEQRLLNHLLGEVRAELDHLNRDVVVVAHDLTPSQTAALDKSKVRGIVTDAGGRTSHTAIVARALGIPAVVALEDATIDASPDDSIIVDGNRGLMIINPDQQQLDEYRTYLEQMEKFESTLVDLTDLPAVTTDGTNVSLLANIEFPEEIPAALEKGAGGIGLYRTEFLYLSTETEPDEQQQFEAYKRAVELMEGRPITIRTIDLGADKYTQERAEVPERNPFLGCRSIRYCLQNLSMFKTHLRAILRASALGQVRIMFPLITNMMELRQARMILNDVMEDLDEQSVKFDPDIKVGMMIEVPSAALMAKVFTHEVDFFSIGTNDLVQYALAVDRGNERVANLYCPGHPAVLMLIKDVIRAAKRRSVEVTCCGEMAGELEYVMLLLGMGLRSLSMTPQSVPEIKKLIRSISIRDCERVARRVAAYDSERQVVNYLREEARKIIPEAIEGRAMM